MTKRTEVIKFCRINGMKAKADRICITLSYDTLRTSMADWVDLFDTWDQAHAFLLAAVHANRDGGTPYPWLKTA